MAYTRLFGPAIEPVTEAYAREHATLDSSLSTGLLTLYLKASRATVEHALGRAVMLQTWEATYDVFTDALKLTMPPVQSVVSVKYYDVNGSLQTIDPANYVLDDRTLPGWVVPAGTYSWPATQDRINAVIVRFTCGWTDAGDVPDEIKHAILIGAADAIDNRETVDRSGRLATVPLWDGLLDRWRVHWSA